MTHNDTSACADGDADRLSLLWAEGYSIAELWGRGEPVTRGTSRVDAAHLLLWGILSIVEYQVSKGAGHRYLRERLWAGDWIAIGNLEPKAPGSPLCCVPRFEHAIDDISKAQNSDHSEQACKRMRATRLERPATRLSAMQA